jgi:outer membrane protein
MPRTPRIALAALGLLSTASGVPQALALDLTLGLGAGVAPDYEGSDDNVAVPLWNVRLGDLYDPETFVQVIGPQLRSNLLPHPHVRVGIAGRYVPDYDNVDNDQVQDIKSTDTALLLGPSLGYDFVAGRETDVLIQVDAIYDVANGNGGLVVPRGRVTWRPADPLTADISLSSSWASDDYMGNFFSVNNSDAARSGLDSYDADAGFKDVTLTASLTYRFAGSWSVTGTASAGRMLGDAADSPVVDDVGDENQLSAGALINYQF